MGEILKQTVERVAKEELNVKVRIIKLYGFLEYTEGSGSGYPISATFIVKPLSKDLVGGEQTKEIGYFKTPPQKTLPEVKKFLRRNYKFL